MTMLKLRDRPEEFLAYVKQIGKEEPLSREGLLTAAVLLEDNRLLERVTEEEEEKSMCTAIDYLCEKAESKGREEGIQKGLESGLRTGRREGAEQSRREMLELVRQLAKANRLEEFLGEQDNLERIDWWMQTYCKPEER